MLNIITSEELIELIDTFTVLRAFGHRPYPVEVWQKAISLVGQFSLKEICEAISVEPAYFRRKMQKFNRENDSPSH